MPKTSVDISFGLYDVSAKQECEITEAPTNRRAIFTPLSHLKLDGVYPPKAATLEQDYWKLDGTWELFPDNPSNTTWGYWSNDMSQSGGYLPPRYLYFKFQNPHESAGLSFEFNPYDNSYASEVQIVWYKEGDVLDSEVFYPNNWRFTCPRKMVGYDQIRIRFRYLNKPNRYLKIQNIKFGEDIIFPPKYVSSANILEEVDLISTELSINTLDFTLYDEDRQFNVFNPNGVCELLQKKQQLNVEGKIDGETVPFGNFYVDKWDTSGAEIKISAIDAIGIMDSTVFDGGVYTNITVSDLIDRVMQDAGFGYTIDTELADKTLTGWLPRCTHREALQQIAFAAGAYADTSRGGMVAIRALHSQTPKLLGRNRKLMGSTVNLKSYVTGVDLTVHQYSLDTAFRDLFKGELPVGEHEIIFPSAAVGVTVTGAEEKAISENYCVINVTAPGEIVVRGRPYVDNTSIRRARVAEIEPGEKEKTIEIKDATLISESNADEIANKILNHYQLRIEQNLSWILDKEVPGGAVNVEVAKDVWREARIIQLDTDLTGGLVTRGVVIGD